MYVNISSIIWMSFVKKEKGFRIFLSLSETACKKRLFHEENQKHNHQKCYQREHDWGDRQPKL
jgi:hypothetical protein